MNLFGWLKPKNFGTVIKGSTRNAITSEWSKINLYLSKKEPAQLRQALIVADKTLDNALRDIVSGESMADRLKNAKNKFEPSLYNKIWEAHKMRNQLVHESGYEPPYHMLITAINDLKAGLSFLGMRV